jgi:hypothetical protein
VREEEGCKGSRGRREERRVSTTKARRRKQSRGAQTSKERRTYVSELSWNDDLDTRLLTRTNEVVLSLSVRQEGDDSVDTGESALEGQDVVEVDIGDLDGRGEGGRGGRSSEDGDGKTCFDERVEKEGTKVATGTGEDDVLDELGAGHGGDRCLLG